MTWVGYFLIWLPNGRPKSDIPALQSDFGGNSQFNSVITVNEDKSLIFWRKKMNLKEHFPRKIFHSVIYLYVDPVTI